jgi:hypothetical protein
VAVASSAIAVPPNETRHVNIKADTKYFLYSGILSLLLWIG